MIVNFNSAEKGRIGQNGVLRGKNMFTFLGDLVFRGKGVNFAGESGSGFAI